MNDWLLGMTTLQEQHYLENYAKNIFSGKGEIVDLGCWLGSTTIPLVKGFIQNPNEKAKSRRIHSFDLFRWEEYMEECVRGTSVEGRFHQGDSFLEEFLERIRPWSNLVKVYASDLHQISWTGKEIELLLIDAMKSWELSNDILQKFFPSMIPGTSYLFQQDFAHYYTSWIHPIHYRLREYFSLVFPIPNSYGFVFQYLKPIPEDLLTAQYDASSFSENEVESAFQYSMQLTTNQSTQANIAAAKVMWHLHLGEADKAIHQLNQYVSSGLPLTGDLKIVSELLKAGKF
jgi:hypothetical protein